jgi:xylan 1,4-beta-xylosidase
MPTQRPFFRIPSKHLVRSKNNLLFPVSRQKQLLLTAIKINTMSSSLLYTVGLFVTVTAQTVPANTNTIDTRACLPPFDTFPFCNPSLSIDERVNDLIERVWATNQSVIPQLLTARNYGKNAIPSLGVPEYDYGLNCIHGVQSSCVLLSDGVTVKCPTSFPNPVNYGSAWNRSLIYDMGRIVGIEARALWLLGAVEQFPRNHIGLDCWSPNINIARAPQWGRNQEVSSEDPTLNGHFGQFYTQGLQSPIGYDPNHFLAISTLKHYDAYSLENSDGFTRHNFNAVVSNYSLTTTYLPAFKQSIVIGGAKSVMCSYNAVNGYPTCSSPMLTQILRDSWSFTGYVTSDSGALEDIYSQHHFTNNSLDTVPVALRDGQCDVCSGNVYSDNLLNALSAGTIAREDIDLALAHTFKIRFQLGLFDAPSASNPYWNIGPDQIGTQEYQDLNLLTTQESMVLLKNINNALPLPKGKKVAIIGPHANATTDMTGNYLGQLCPDNSFDCLVSPYLAINSLNSAVGGTTNFVLGCKINGTDPSYNQAIALAQSSDIIILALGIDDSIEAEGHDRVSIDLPQVQHDLVTAIVAAAPGKPIVIYLLNGGCVDVTAELNNPSVGAILYAGYPGMLGGTVIAQSLFGDNDHLGGKLATTWYPSSYASQIPMSEMELDVGVGRGDRFYSGEKVFSFGFGLSLTTFVIAPVSGFTDNDAVVTLPTATSTNAVSYSTYSVQVTNTGNYSGDEVVQLFFYPLSMPLQPKSVLIRQLIDYQRVHLAPGETTIVSFGVSAESFKVAHKDTGDIISTPGDFELRVVRGHGDEVKQRFQLVGSENILEKFPVQ